MGRCPKPRQGRNKLRGTASCSSHNAHGFAMRVAQVWAQYDCGLTNFEIGITHYPGQGAGQWRQRPHMISA